MQKSCGAVRCGGDPIYDCYDELPESSCSKPKACKKNPQRCAKTCNLCRERGDYTCIDLDPKFCKKLVKWKFDCQGSNFFRCKKTCGAVKCGYGVDDCFDELPESKCRKSNACDGAWKYGAANPNFAGCKKTCNLC